jgi:hypothetical protein
VVFCATKFPCAARENWLWSLRKLASCLVNPRALHEHCSVLDLPAWLVKRGVTDPGVGCGGVVQPHINPPTRQVTLVQCKPGKLGANLGKTTHCIHHTGLKMEQRRDAVGGEL